MKSIKAIFILVLAITSNNAFSAGDIDYRTIKTNKTTPIDLSLSHVEFFGANKTAIENLNSAVKEIWNDDKGCDLSDIDKNTLAMGGEYHRTLEVKKLTNTIVVLKDTADYSCPGAAHPGHSTNNYVIDIANGKTIDFWKHLSTENQNKILFLISANEIKIRGNDECRDNYQLTELQNTSINIAFDAGNVSLEPDFPHAIQACVETLTMPIAEFKKYFAGDKKMQTILMTLQ